MNHPIIDLVMRLLSYMFLIGMFGSAIVVAISFVEDLYELLVNEGANSHGSHHLSNGLTLYRIGHTLTRERHAGK